MNLIRKSYHRLRFGNSLSGNILVDVNQSETSAELRSVIRAYRGHAEWMRPELVVMLSEKSHELKRLEAGK